MDINYERLIIDLVPIYYNYYSYTNINYLF